VASLFFPKRTSAAKAGFAVKLNVTDEAVTYRLCEG